eukprot:scaffold316184_cov34-Prasinocladus_malaysianus.AAC.1
MARKVTERCTLWLTMYTSETINGTNVARNHQSCVLSCEVVEATTYIRQASRPPHGRVAVVNMLGKSARNLLNKETEREAER